MSKLVDTHISKQTFCEATDEQKARGVLGVLKGRCQYADKKNANQRIYPRSLWEKVLTSPDFQAKLKGRHLIGEIDHPPTGITSYKNTSHVTTYVEMKPNGEVYGEHEILNTPNGCILHTLAKAGVPVGTSSRGDGSIVNTTEADVVQDDFTPDGWDMVTNPSTPEAWTYLGESRDTHTSLLANSLVNLVHETNDFSVLEGVNNIADRLAPNHRQRLNESIDQRRQELSSIGNKFESTNDPKEDFRMKISDQDRAAISASVINEVNEAKTKQLVEQHLEEKDNLNHRISQLAGDNSDLRKKLDAAEKLVEETARQYKEMMDRHEDEDLLYQKEEEEKSDLEQKLAAAKELIDALLQSAKKSTKSEIGMKSEMEDEYPEELEMVMKEMGLDPEEMDLEPQYHDMDYDLEEMYGQYEPEGLARTDAMKKDLNFAPSEKLPMAEGKWAKIYRRVVEKRNKSLRGLLEAAVAKLRESRQYKVELEAAKSLIEAQLELQREDKLSTYVESKVSRFADQSKVRVLLEGAETKDEVDKRLQALSAFSPTQSTREPLPTPRSLSESRNSRSAKQSKKSDSFLRNLLARTNGQ